MLSEEEVRTGSMLWARVQTGRVPYGEESRKYRRTVYAHADWPRHRASSRLFKNLRTTIFSGVVRGFLGQVATVACIALFVVVFNLIATRWWSAAMLLSLPSLPFTLSSPALGLLLVFRTNASYARWLEARTLWSRIVSHSRNILRQAAVWSTASGDEAARERASLAASVWAFPRCLVAHLRGDDDEGSLEEELTTRLGDGPAKRLLDASAYRPMVALCALSEAIETLSVDEKRRVEMDKSVILLMDA
jgi:putative membrane protein